MPRHFAVQEIDATTVPDELLLAVHAVEESCSRVRPFREPGLSLAFYRHWSEGVRRRWVAARDGDVAGAAALLIHSPTFVEVEVFVRPDARRRGIGSALLEAVVAAACEQGVASFFAYHSDAAGAAFARAHGAVDGQRDVRAELRLREAALPAPEPPSGWRLVSWLGAAPEELLESYALARAAIDDAPSPGGDLAPIDVEWVRAMERTAEARGRELRVTIAIDGGGRVGAFTDLRVGVPPSPVASTDDTATIAAVRGLGLATAVKLESLRLLREARPDVELVRTTNAEQNVAMRAVNARVGFRPVETLTAAILTL